MADTDHHDRGRVRKRSANNGVGWAAGKIRESKLKEGSSPCKGSFLYSHTGFAQSCCFAGRELHTSRGTRASFIINDATRARPPLGERQC